MIIDLIEGQPRFIPRSGLTEVVASKIFSTHCLDIDFPSPANAYQYRLLASTTVGQIPIDPDVLIRIQPKVQIQSIFQMLEMAYRLQSFRWHDGLVEVDELPELFERLASILSRRILDRGRKGLHREYCSQQQDLSYVRGRVNTVVTSLMFIRGVPSIRCQYEDQSPDIEDNQILLHTLTIILRMPLAKNGVRKSVRMARRLLLGSVSLRPVQAAECLHRIYNRLDQDYQPLHALCRFFLQNSGPSLANGDCELIPFTVDMPGLFELFVAEWIKKHAPDDVIVRSQYKTLLDDEGMLCFKVDMVLFHRDSNRCIAVLDTKYKSGALPLESDIQQIIAYAVKLGSAAAYLVYPSPITRRIDMNLGGIRLKSIVFDIGGKIEETGKAFMDTLFGDCPRPL